MTIDLPRIRDLEDVALRHRGVTRSMEYRKSRKPNDVGESLWDVRAGKSVENSGSG